MSQPTLVELWVERYENLNEQGRVSFLMNLKREYYEQGNHDAGEAFVALCKKWMTEPLK